MQGMSDSQRHPLGKGGSMSDIVKQLRHMAFETWDDQPTECEAIVQKAAAEIERLRHEVTECEEAHEVTMRMLAYEAERASRAEAQVGALREALEQIAEHPGPHACEGAFWRSGFARDALKTAKEGA